MAKTLPGHDSVSPTYTKATKHDTNPQYARALWVGTAGTANLADAEGNAITDFPLKAGLNPIIVTLVKTGGTADDIWLLA